MYSTLLTVALFIATLASSVLAEFAISTPEFTQCQTSKISWEKTIGPYNVIIVDAANPCGDPILEIGDIDNTVTEWQVALPAGITVQIYAEDSGDDEAWSGKILVKDSNDTSCISQDVANKFGVSLPHSSTAASPSTHPSSTPSAVGGTTLVVPPKASPTPSPIGAANAGTDPFPNGASRLHQVSTPVPAICAFVAFVMLSL